MPVDARLWRADERHPVKNYLMEYRVLQQRREALERELEYLRAAATRATTLLSGARPSGRSAPDGRENAMLRVVDGETKLTQVTAHIGEALAARLALIEQLPDERQKTLLTLRYIRGLNWEQLGYTMHYERTQLFQIHTQALEAAQQAWDALQGPPLV
ncbi:MAG: hypothetical protein PHO41_09845 [Eubacteriales bacterium]|nr:hypothetical protein [Eubacteriales bacterium]